MAVARESWGLVRRLTVCLVVFAVLAGLAVVIALGEVRSGGVHALLLLGLVANGVYGYHAIVRPLRELDARYLRFNRGYDAKAIFETPLFFTRGEQQAMRKIAELLDNQEVNRLSNRQAQYLALQNQINPHFLYNTLEAIRGDALSAGMRDVAAITEALATFFRYTISNMDNLVSVEEELSNAENYFAIQNYRFGERISMQVTIEPGCEAVMDLMIPKLTLQPIIENAIIHGLEERVGPGHVAVHLAMDAARLLIDVRDDGVGMDESVLDEINRRLVFPEGLKSREDKSRAGGIALINVNNRIKLLFGEQYGLRVSSIKGTGTRVAIQLPVRRGEEGRG